MQQLIYFIQKYKYVLFFLLLQFIALTLTINNHSFHRSKFINSANSISGGIYEKGNAISNYLSLEEQNNALIQENTRLRNLLSKIQYTSDSATTSSNIDSLQYHQKYQYINGVIVKNEFRKVYNYLTINRGEKDGVTSEMAVINNRGIIGVTDAASNSYARVRSIINRNTEINVRLKKSSYYGTLNWDGKDYKTVQLVDIPRQAVLTIGDTIITSGRSTIFPEGILIGTISNTDNRKTANTIDIKLFNDMRNVHNIYVINNFHKQEIKGLEKQTNE